MTPLRPQPRRGIALIEAVVSLVIISVMMVAALNTVGASRMGQRANADRLRGLALASDLMSEIMSKAYADPNEAVLFGPEVSEVLVGRAAYDDVDDYSGYHDGPPRDAAGNQLTGLANWTRDVTVAFVAPADLTKTVVTDNGIKLITVTVRRGGQLMAKLTGLRTAAGPS